MTTIKSPTPTRFIIAAARWHLEQWRKTSIDPQAWPEDDWVTLTPNIDCNFYVLESPAADDQSIWTPSAMLYPIQQTEAGPVTLTEDEEWQTDITEEVQAAPIPRFGPKLREAAKYSYTYGNGQSGVRAASLSVYDMRPGNINYKANGQPEYWAQVHTRLSTPDYLACRSLLERYKRYLNYVEEVEPEWKHDHFEYFADNSTEEVQINKRGQTRRRMTSAPSGDACF